ncbi:transposase [Candidatus Bathyarchaeota archaeon]|nr:transposase [Candidatus Bathyarchaeota archaeon]
MLNSINVVYLPRRQVRNTSRTCHRCRHVAQANGRELRCPNRGLIYNRDLNACVNIARRIMSPTGWGSCKPPEPAYEGIGVKPTLNAGSPPASAMEKLTSHLF